VQLSKALRTFLLTPRPEASLANSSMRICEHGKLAICARSMMLQQQEQKEEYWEHGERQDEGILASSSQAFVLIFARCAAEVPAHGDRS
jgi:hypothetical protein